MTRKELETAGWRYIGISRWRRKTALICTGAYIHMQTMASAYENARVRGCDVYSKSEGYKGDFIPWGDGTFTQQQEALDSLGKQRMSDGRTVREWALSPA